MRRKKLSSRHALLAKLPPRPLSAKALSELSLLEQKIGELQSELSKQEESKPLFANSKCHSCLKEPLRGKRFRCLLCDHFEQCAPCEAANLHPHPMIRLVENLNEDLESRLVRRVQKWTNLRAVKALRAFEGDLDRKKRVFLEKKFGNRDDQEAIRELVERYRGLSFEEFMGVIEEADAIGRI